MMDQVDFLGQLRTISVQPGDTVVLMTERHLSDEVCGRLKAHLQSVFTDNQVLVLCSDLQLGVVSKRETLGRIESKLDTLIAALADEEEPADPLLMLDGFPPPRERDQGESLG